MGCKHLQNQGPTAPLTCSRTTRWLWPWRWYGILHTTYSNLRVLIGFEVCRWPSCSNTRSSLWRWQTHQPYSACESCEGLNVQFHLPTHLCLRNFYSQDIHWILPSPSCSYILLPESYWECYGQAKTTPMKWRRLWRGFSFYGNLYCRMPLCRSFPIFHSKDNAILQFQTALGTFIKNYRF